MPTFGRFETYRLVYESPVGVIWRARASGEKAPDFVVKTFQPDPDGADAAERTQAFEAAAELQQRVAARSPYWAPVLARGANAHGAFYVTRYYPRSAKHLIDERVVPSARQLHVIMDSVSRGLEDLQAVGERVSGNLKPSNVLIGSTRGIQPGDVVVTDPHQATPDAFGLDTDDLLPLGELLHELVTHRRVDGRTASPMPLSPEWRRLGRSGPRWLDLCNVLLNTQLPTAERSLAAVRARLAGVADATGRRPRHRRALAAVVVVGGMVAAAGYVAREDVAAWVQRARVAVARQIVDAPQHAPPDQGRVEADVGVEADGGGEARPVQLATSGPSAARAGDVTDPIYQLAASADPVLSRFPQFARAGTVGGRDSRPGADAEAVRALADELAQAAAWRTNPAAVPPPDPASLRSPTEADFRARLAALRAARVPDEPDPRAAVRPHIAGAEQRVGTSDDVPPATRATAWRHLADARRALDEQGGPWVERDQGAIAAAAASAERSVKSADSAVAEAQGGGDVAAWSAAERARPAPAVRDDLVREWTGRRDWLLSEAARDPASAGRLRRSVGELRTAYADLAADLPPPPAAAASGRPGSSSAPDWDVAVSGAVERRYKAALAGALPPPGKELIRALTPADDHSVRERWQSDRAWIASATAVRHGLEELQELLGGCYAPDEPSRPGGPTVATLLEVFKRELAWPDLSALPPVRSLDATARRTLAVRSAGRGEWAAVLLRQPPEPAPVLAAGWAAAGATPDWPASTHELDAELKGSAQLLASAPAARPDFPRLIREGRRQRWARYLTGAGVGSTTAALEWFGRRLGERSVRADELPDWFNYNLQLAGCRQSPADAAALERLLSAATATPALLRDRPELGPVRDGLRAGLALLMAGAEAGGPGARPAHGGPGTAGPRLRLIQNAYGDLSFDVPAAEDDASNTYELAFVLVRPRNPDVPAFYMSTTEVSVGLFSAVAERAGVMREVGALLDGPRGEGTASAASNPRPLAAWTFDHGRIVPAARWHGLPDDVWPAPVSPSLNHPMQYVSPQAAHLFARLLGCRLPTSAEWAAALDDAKARPSRHPWAMQGWKLRDDTWDGLRQVPGTTTAADNFGGFLPAASGHRPSDRSWTDAALQAEGGGLVRTARASHLTASNSVVFREVNYPGYANAGFYDLVGNVAEYVLDASPVASVPRTAQSLSAAEADSFIHSHAAALHVIGGSVLSPPDIPPRQKQAVELDRAARGFSDVGFRLAFAAPAADPQAFVRAVLRDAPFLSPPTAPTAAPAAGRRAAPGGSKD